MAKYKKGNSAKYSESAVDNDDLDFEGVDADDEHASIATTLFNLNGKPFSAVYKSVLPKYFVENAELFDEFGFRLAENASIDQIPELETSQQRMKWLAHIQFSTESIDNELKWADVNVEKLRGDKLDELLRANGIPHSLRPFLWAKFSGGTNKKNSSVPYSKIRDRCERESSANIEGQIDKDLLRTMPNNYCFDKMDSPGVQALRRVLKAVAFMYPDIGYCQGMGVVASTLLLVCGEETCFWIMCALIEDILPPSFYSHNLLGLQADERVVKHLMCVHTGELVKIIKEKEVDISMITINWLLTLFANIFSFPTVLRLWDYIFTDGGAVVFKVIISMFKMREQDIIIANAVADNCPAELFNTIGHIPATISDVNGLIDYMLTFNASITPETISILRKKYQGMLMVDSGMIFGSNNDDNLPKQTMNKRKLSRSKSYIPNIFNLSTVPEDPEDDPKTKNIRQTEMIVDLRNAVGQICRHFSLCPEKHEHLIDIKVDYSLESHDKDRENFSKCRREGKKRARALLDFQRQEEDELGFQKNDIVNIVSDKDEHCWIGEVDGRRGWFPAKFVSLIDERAKNYCVYGDESVESKIGEIVRGQFSHAFCRIIGHGIRETSVIMSTFVGHPWLYIEDLANNLNDNHSKTFNSKVTLCDAFRLDQDGKVLTPEELLIRAVNEINQSYSSDSAFFDYKLRSLIAYALNEQCLHLWFEIMCDSAQQNAIREKYYHPYAFTRSPVWRQIKCELRILSQLSFSMNIQAEIDDELSRKGATSKFLSSSQSKNTIRKASSIDSSTNGRKQPLREGVRDMLIKHHLFSWDL